MAKWVAAQVDDGRWVRIVGFDDGWVEMPGMARQFAQVRGNLRSAGVGLIVLVGGIAAVIGAGTLMNNIGVPPGWVAGVCAIAVLTVFITALVLNITIDARNRRAAIADRAQAKADRVAGRRLEMVPGAAKWRRATSAAELASRVRNVTLVRRDDIASVTAAEDGADQAATVTMVDGTVRRYRSPDRTLGGLLGSYDPHHLGA